MKNFIKNYCKIYYKLVDFSINQIYNYGIFDIKL